MYFCFLKIHWHQYTLENLNKEADGDPLAWICWMLCLYCSKKLPVCSRGKVLRIPRITPTLRHHCSWLSSRSSEGRNLYCCCRIMASFFLASSSSLSFRSISSWAAMIYNTTQASITHPVRACKISLFTFISWVKNHDNLERTELYRTHSFKLYQESKLASYLARYLSLTYKVTFACWNDDLCQVCPEYTVTTAGVRSLLSDLFTPWTPTSPKMVSTIAF